MKKYYFILLSILLQATNATAQWQALNGPFGDNTSLPVFFDSTYYTATYQGMITSTDDGQTWNESNLPFYERYMSIVYFNEGKLIYNRAYIDHGWISLDSGATWSAMDTAISTYPPVRYFVSNGVIYITCIDGFMFKSHDNGVTWSPYYNPPTLNGMNDFTEDNGRLYWVTSGNGPDPSHVYYSDNEGMSWLIYPTTGIPNPGTFYQVVPNGNQLFVSCNTGIYKTTDAGSTWTLFDTGLPSGYAYFYHYTRLYAAAEKLYAYVHNGASIYRSDTSTAGFTNISNGLPFEIYVSGVAEHNNKLYFSSPSGLFATDKTNINWQSVSANIRMRSCSAINALDSTLIMGGNYSMHVSPDNGDSFMSMPSGEATSTIYVRDSTIYAATARGLKSTDHGNTWTSMNFPYGFFGQNLVDFCVLGNYWFGKNSGDQMVKYSNNNGTTWTNLTGLPANSVTCIESSNTRLFAGTSNGIYKSVNNGTTWTTTLTGYNVADITFENGNLIVNAGYKIWVSHDDGATWQDMNYPYAWPQSFTVNNNTVVVTPGLYYTSDFGVNWDSIAAPVMINQTNPNLLLLTDSWLFAVFYDTTFKMPASVLTSLHENNLVQPQILVYPNPVKSEISISLEQLNEGHLNIELFDVYGKKICTLFDKKIPSGKFVKSFDISYLSTGIYFLRISEGDRIQNKRIIKM